jgi:tetratricopeptide (TPR) repeat protein
VKKVWHELESPFDRSFYALWIGSYLHQIGNSQAGEEYCRQSFQLIGDQKDRLQQWYRLITLAFILEERGKVAEACEIYQQAVSLGDQMNLPRHALEAQAGLARISLASGETEQALILVNDILVYMIENTQPSGSSYPLDGMFDPFRVLLTCYHALKANNDPRAEAFLMDAYNLLQTRAANISDEHLRDCFLNNVAVNREIVEEYEVLGLENGLTS